MTNHWKKTRTAASNKSKNKHDDNWTIVIVSGDQRKKNKNIIQGFEVNIVKNDEDKHVNETKNITSNDTKSHKPRLRIPKKESVHQGLKRITPKLEFKTSSPKDTDEMMKGNEDHSCRNYNLMGFLGCVFEFLQIPKNDILKMQYMLQNKTQVETVNFQCQSHQTE